MTNIKTKTAGRIAVAAVLSMGLTAGAVSIASASSDHGTRVSDHDHGFSWNLQGRIEGVVSSYTAGSSIAVVSRGATTATTYTLTSATTVTGLAAGASMLNDHVVLVMSTTTPATVLSIKVETPKSNCNGAKDGTNGNGANGNFKASDDNLSRHGFAYQGFSHGNSSRHGNFRR
jgi:hypothetical protein